MTLSNGREYLAIPGPSVIPDRVLQAMHRPSPNIYTGELAEIIASLRDDLKRVAGTSHGVAMYIANGHGVWEAALANTLRHRDKVLILATGQFAIHWAGVAGSLGIETDIMDFGINSEIDAARVGEILKGDTKHTYRAVLAVHVDTATSVRSDISALRAVMDSADHPALLMVDCIASLGCDRFEMDATGIDVAIAGCQKGLMTPAGMGFVFFNEKAAQARERLATVSAYWDWKTRAETDHLYQYFCGTPPTHHIYGLREALDMILENEGLEAVLHRHAVLARAVWAAFDAWSREGLLKMTVTDPSIRSHAVTSAEIGAPHGTELRNWVTGNVGITLGIGLGMADPSDPAWHGFFRIGHMGHVNGQMIMGVLGSIDAGLKALKILHGENALEAASAIIANG